MLLVIPLRFLYGEELDPDVNSKEIYRYLWPVIISLLCFNILTQMDIVLVKHFFHPAEAGYYSGAAMMGRIVLFLPLAMATVMFPKVTEASTLNRDPRSILVKSLLAVGVLCGAVTVAFFIAPSLLISLSYGSKFVSSASLVGLFGIAMTFFALLNLLIYYHLSVHRFGFLYALAGLTLAQLTAIWFFHNSLVQVIIIMAANALILCVISWLLAYRESGASSSQEGI